jgi:hypothetical protein
MTERPHTDWWTYRETSAVLLVAPKTLQNLASKHKLKRVRRWQGKGRGRRMICRLHPASVRELARLTGNSHLISP